MVDIGGETWEIVNRPGYQAKNRDTQTALCNEQYGQGNWRLAWILENGEILNFEKVFYCIYVPGYTKYFNEHFDETKWITDNFSYGYDKDPVTKPEAFDPYTLYSKPGRVNQFHHVALNIALEYYLGVSFKGQEPLQIREGKPGTDCKCWPKGWYWSPGRIPTVRPDLIPQTDIKGWWQEGTVEAVYQKAKTLLRKV